MKKLEEYAALNDFVFYRHYHILEYIKLKEPLSSLDREALAATIMHALVDLHLIDKERETLDLDNLCIRDDGIGYHYEEHPFAQGTPLWIKDQLRKKCLMITGGLPVTMKLSMLSPFQKTCVYDLNTAYSCTFSKFTFYEADYDSPTRPGVIAKDRPFLEVEIDGVKYLVDTLLDRLYLSEEFKKRYHMQIKSQFDSWNLNANQQNIYSSHVQESNHYFSGLIAIFDLFQPSFNQPYFAEYNFEYQRAHENFPEIFQEARDIMQDKPYKNLSKKNQFNK